MAVQLPKVSRVRSALSLYVATTGNDTTGDGTSGNKWATITKALSYLADKRLEATVTINLADGTYTHSSETFLTHPDGQRIEIIGNTTTPANVVISCGTHNGFDVRDTVAGGYINGVKLLGNWAGSGATGYQASAFYVGRGASLRLGPKVVIDDFYYGVQACNNGIVTCDSITITDAGDAGLFAYEGGTIIAASATISNCRDTTNNLGSGVVAEIGGVVHCDSLSVTTCRTAGIHAISGKVRCYNVTADGNTGHGIYAEKGSLIEAGGTCSADSNGGSGLFVDSGAVFQMYGGSTLTTNSNTSHGISAINARARAIGLTCTGNGGAGIRSYNGSQVEAEGATVTGNTGWGLDVFLHSCVISSGATINTNTAGAIIAQILSGVYVVGSTISGTVNPTANATGNQNSWIKTT